VIRAHKTPARGDALVRRQVAQWRRITGRLQVLINTGQGLDALADEAHTLRRQCERLASELGQVAMRRAPAPAGRQARASGQTSTQCTAQPNRHQPEQP
jgi:hypothetical protein